jgi:hypothetical protein
MIDVLSREPEAVRLNDEKRLGPVQPTLCLSLWLQSGLQIISFRLRLGLLLHESLQETAGLLLEQALCPTAKPEL